MPLRFTIRDLLWLTVVVGMGIGWWVDRRQSDRKYQVGQEFLVNQTNRILESEAQRANDAERKLREILENR